MSKWTYVTGIVELDTYSRSTPETMYLAQTVVNHLPRITGSEHDAQLSVSLVPGENISSNVDEFEQHSNLYNNSYFSSFETQSCVQLTIRGHLRDRDFAETLRETVRMLSRLASRLSVESCLVSVKGQGKTFIFDDPEWLHQITPSDWAKDLLWSWADDDKKEEQHHDGAE